MKIIKCDICKKTLSSDSEKLQLSYLNKDILYFESFELCGICGKPIIKILKARKLINIENKKNGKNK